MSDVSRIAVIEDQDLVRHGLERVLSGSSQWLVVAAVRSPSDLLCDKDEWDVVLYGPAPDADESIAEAGADLAARGGVLVMCDAADPAPTVSAIRAGALGCVTRQVSTGELLAAVQTVAIGGYYVSAELAPGLQAELFRSERPEPRILARRELETLRWLVDGLTHGQIARRMGLTEATVSTYVKRIRSKLDVGNKADLTRAAIELGLLRRPVPEAAAVPRRHQEPRLAAPPVLGPRA